MLGEFVSLYDTAHDLEDPNSVTTSHTNSEPRSRPNRIQQNIEIDSKTSLRSNSNQGEDQQPQNVTMDQNLNQPAPPTVTQESQQMYYQPMNNLQQGPYNQGQSAQITYIPVYMTPSGQVFQGQQNQQIVQQNLQNPGYPQQPQMAQQRQYVQQPQFVQSQFTQPQGYQQQNYGC